MTIQHQLIVVVVLIVTEAIPSLIVYLFLPETSHGIISLMECIGKGITISFGLCISLIMVIILVMVIPIIGFPLIGIIIYIIYKNWKRTIKLAKYNYKYYHLNK